MSLRIILNNSLPTVTNFSKSISLKPVPVSNTN